MEAVAEVTRATRLPGPPELLPVRPDAIVDLQTEAGVALVGGEWRYSDAEVREVAFVQVGSAADPLGPGDVPNRTYDVVPHAETLDYDDSGWRTLSPEETRLRLSNGRVCFNWYRLLVTIPERVGDLDPTGSTVVFEIVVDSAFVGTRKPERRIFELTLERLGGGLRFEDCLLVDDLSVNCDAARALGWSTPPVTPSW